MAEACLIIKAERQFPCANGRPLQKEKAQPKEKEKVVKPNYKRIAGAPAPRRQKRETDRNGFVFHFSRYAHFHQKRAIIIRCSKILFLSLGRRWHTQNGVRHSRIQNTHQAGLFASNFQCLYAMRFHHQKKNGIDYPEINFYYFVAIGAKEILDCYIHDYFKIAVFRVHWLLLILRLR